MIGLILSAGKGTRLGKLTKDTPKVMIEVGGKPVLEYLVERLEVYGVNPIIVNTHHYPLKIMEHFGDRCLYTYEPKLLGEKGTIESLKHFLKRDFAIIMNGDTLTDLNLNTMFMMSKGKNIRYMDGDVYAGTKIINPEYFDNAPTFVNYQDASAKWYDIGTPEGLRKARKAYE